MRVCVSLLASMGLATTASAAQGVPAPAPAPIASVPASAAKPQTVKKVVCSRVIEEETTGSRLGSAPKKCKTIEVPVSGAGGSKQAPLPERGGN